MFTYITLTQIITTFILWQGSLEENPSILIGPYISPYIAMDLGQYPPVWTSHLVSKRLSQPAMA